MQAVWATLGAVLITLSQAQPAPAQPDNQLAITDCVVSLIDDVEVPARVEGSLVELVTEPGAAVEEGDLLARIDDEQVKRQREIAEYELAVAKEKAENDVNIRYAEWSEMVAKAEYQQAIEANKTAPRAVTQAELRRRMLEWGRTQLGIEQAQHDLSIAKTTIKVREAELRAAEHNVEMREITAPLQGIIVERHRQQGEWVKPGEPVFRIVRMNRLRIATSVDATQLLPGQLDGQPVTFTLTLPDGRQHSFQGRVVFVSPLVDLGMKFEVRAELDNRRDPQSDHWLLRPGLSGTLTINLSQ